MMTKTIQNVLFLVADQWRGDTLAALGQACMQTSNLDALATDSVLWRHPVTQASPCGPARVSMLAVPRPLTNVSTRWRLELSSHLLTDPLSPASTAPFC